MVTGTAIVLVIVIVILVRKLHRAKGKVAMDTSTRCSHHFCAGSTSTGLELSRFSEKYYNM